MPSTQWFLARSELRAASAQLKPHGMQFITVMIPLRFQLDALINDLVWVIKQEQREGEKNNNKRGLLCFFFFVVAGHKSSQWFLWFVALAPGHVVMKVLAF